MPATHQIERVVIGRWRRFTDERIADGGYIDGIRAGIDRWKWRDQLESLGETAEARTDDQPIMCRRDAADGIGITMVGAG
jgi:hypothetical protein